MWNFVEFLLVISIRSYCILVKESSIFLTRVASLQNTQENSKSKYENGIECRRQKQHIGYRVFTLSPIKFFIGDKKHSKWQSTHLFFLFNNLTAKENHELSLMLLFAFQNSTPSLLFYSESRVFGLFVQYVFCVVACSRSSYPRVYCFLMLLFPESFHLM